MSKDIPIQQPTLMTDQFFVRGNDGKFETCSWTDIKAFMEDVSFDVYVHDQNLTLRRVGVLSLNFTEVGATDSLPQHETEVLEDSEVQDAENNGLISAEATEPEVEAIEIQPIEGTANNGVDHHKPGVLGRLMGR